MKVKDLIKLFKDHNPEADIIINKFKTKSISVGSTENCISCEKEVHLSIQ